MFISIQEANAAIGSMDSAYYGIIIKGFYMPKRRSSIITTQYLFKVMTGKVFRIKQSEVNIGQRYQKASNLQLFGYLQTIQVEKPWGIDEEHLPDKTWIVNVLYTLNPTHAIFKSQNLECKSILYQDDLKVIQSFNTSHSRSTQGRFFKRTKQQSEAFKIASNSTQKQRKKRKIEEKLKKIDELKLQITNLQGDQIQEEQQH